VEDETDDAEMNPVPIELVPGLARLAVGAWIRGAEWGVGTTVRAAQRLGSAAVSGESAVELIGEVRDEALSGLHAALAALEQDESAQAARQEATAERHGWARGAVRAQSLRERGAALFERSADVGRDDGVHPGFDRIVDQLAPDEARILKLLVNEGPQPIVYVNKAAPLGIGAREVARRLSIIDREAGCMHSEHVPAYLDNLVRLGLVAIRRDPIPDEQAYQVVEAQPEVVEAMKSVNGTLFRGHSTRRSVHVTDFGRTFCQAAFPPEHLTGEFDAVNITGLGKPTDPSASSPDSSEGETGDGAAGDPETEGAEPGHHGRRTR
jgi:hypothetical protein